MKNKFSKIIIPRLFMKTRRIVLYFHVFFFLSKRDISSNFYLSNSNEIGGYNRTNAWNRNLGTEKLYSWITVVFYLVNAKRILSLRNLFRSTVSSKVSHLFRIACYLQYVSKEPERKGKHLIGNILKTYIFIVYRKKISNKIFIFSKRDIIFFMTTFRYNSRACEDYSNFRLHEDCWRI